MVICFAVAWLTSHIGLSLSLGAFLAGLIISESEYSNEAMANVAPFYELFTSFFFISIGMLLDVGFILEHPVTVLLLTISVLLLKTLIVSLAVFLMRLPLRTVMIVGLSLAQVGEFSFILSRVGIEYELLDEVTNQYFLSISILSMAVTPFMIGVSHALTRRIMKAPLPEFIKRRFSYSRLQKEMPVDKKELHKGHLIIVGAGLNGQNLAKAAKSIDIPYLILELNPDLVEQEKEKGEPILFGDAVHPPVLEQAHVRKAKVVAVAISDPVSTRRIVSNVRQIDPTIHIIVRTRYVNEVSDLYELGADEVIPEEFETSVEIFSRVMSLYLIPKQEIDRFAHSLREDSYEMFRSSPERSITMENLKEHIDDTEIITLKVGSDSVFVGQKLSEIDIRKRFDVTLLAIGREGNIQTNPSGEETILAGDKLILFGSPEKIQEFGGFVSQG
jgi:CPA2 family monovalent cation:H+ antiporter-2